MQFDYYGMNNYLSIIIGQMSPSLGCMNVGTTDCVLLCIGMFTIS